MSKYNISILNSVLTTYIFNVEVNCFFFKSITTAVADVEYNTVKYFILIKEMFKESVKVQMRRAQSRDSELF